MLWYNCISALKIIYASKEERSPRSVWYGVTRLIFIIYLSSTCGIFRAREGERNLWGCLSIEAGLKDRPALCCIQHLQSSQSIPEMFAREVYNVLNIDSALISQHIPWTNYRSWQGYHQGGTPSKKRDRKWYNAIIPKFMNNATSMPIEKTQG